MQRRDGGQPSAPPASSQLRGNQRGGKPTAGIIKDTVNFPKNSTVEVDFVANNAGESLVHCHMQQHMDFGFKALVKYE
jgi:FtsP/CotA-like multicopper oxidase with cupredoxin domain